MITSVTKILVLLTVFKVIKSEQKLVSNYEWSTDYVPYHEQIIPWNNTLLRIQNCRWGTNNAWYCFRTVDPSYEHPVKCDVRTVKKTRDFEIFFVTAVALENGKVVMKLNDFKYLIVDLISCTKIVLNFKIPVESHQVIPRSESFDINEGNALATFSDQGDFVKRALMPKKWYHEIKRFSKLSSRSFFSLKRYREQCRSGSEKCNFTQMSVMNSKYELVQENILEHSVEAYSFAHRRFTFCYVKDHTQSEGLIMEPTAHTIQCNFRNKDLHLERETVVGTSRERDMAVHNLAGGGAIVLYNGSEGSDDGTIIYRIIDGDGKPGEEGVFMKTQGFMASDFEIFLFEKDPVERIYCGVMARPYVVFGKCFKVYQ